MRLFNEIPVECYYVWSSPIFHITGATYLTSIQLEYDTSRAGTFEPLKFVPKDKVVILGLLTSKFPKVSLP